MDRGKERVIAGDIAGAVQYFSAQSSDAYRNEYLSIGASDLGPLMSQIPAIAPVFIDRNEAQYRFDQVVQGTTISFPIHFIRENGTWKILEYRREQHVRSTVRRAAIGGAVLAAFTATIPVFLDIFQTNLRKAPCGFISFRFACGASLPGAALAEILGMTSRASIWAWWILNVFAGVTIGSLVGAEAGYATTKLRTLKQINDR